jgi:CHASE2 domain-containing sensor protein
MFFAVFNMQKGTRANKWKRRLTVFVIWLLAFGIERVLEHLGTFHIFHPAIYSCAAALRGERAEPRLHVMLVDISDWTSTNGLTQNIEVPTLWERRKPVVTDRLALQRLVMQLAKLEPAAIGLDIDLSYSDALPDKSNHFKLLQTCLDLSARTPVIIGIGRTFGEEPEAWLGAPDFRGLAAGVWRNEGANLELPTKFEWTTRSGQKVSIHSLSQALASNYWAKTGKPQPKHSSLTKFFLSRGTEEHFHGPYLEGRSEKMFVDYQDLPHFQRADNVLRASDLLSDAGLEAARTKVEMRKKKDLGPAVFIVGDLRPTNLEDVAIVPSHPEPLPGLLLHASAVTTLLQHPVWVNNLGSDLGAALLALFLTKGIAWLLRLENMRHARLRATVELGLAITCSVVVAVAAYWILHILPFGVLASMVAGVLEFLLSFNAKVLDEDEMPNESCGSVVVLADSGS